jgi:polar amino acid transport system substrate-binding protein
MRRSGVRVSLVVGVLVAFFVTVGLVPSGVWAGKIMNRILSKGTLVVGTTGHFPPFSVKDKEGKYIGLDMDLARAMASAMGVKLEVKRYDMSDLIEAVRKHKVDMAMSGITMTFERNLKVIFVGPYMVTGQAILAKKAVVQQVKSPADMNKPSFRLVVVKGTTGATVARLLAPKATIIEKNTMTEAFNMVLKDKADALLADQPYCVVAAFQHRDQPIGVSEPFTQELVGIALPEGDELLVNWVENFIMQLQVKGELKKLKEFWFQNPSWIKEIPTQ